MQTPDPSQRSRPDRPQYGYGDSSSSSGPIVHSAAHALLVSVQLRPLQQSALVVQLPPAA
jgi:hypothetical protein